MMAKNCWFCVLYHVSTGIIFRDKKTIWYYWLILDLEEFESLWVTWLEECWSKVIWFKTLSIVYPDLLVSIRIWHSKSKCLRIEVSVKAFRRSMKAFLALVVRKSVPELTFTKLTFGKSDFLDLVNFDFLNLAKFIIVDRFLILPSTQLLLIPPLQPGESWFFLFLVA